MEKFQYTSPRILDTEMFRLGKSLVRDWFREWQKVGKMPVDLLSMLHNRIVNTNNYNWPWCMSYVVQNQLLFNLQNGQQVDDHNNSFNQFYKLSYLELLLVCRKSAKQGNDIFYGLIVGLIDLMNESGYQDVEIRSVMQYIYKKISIIQYGGKGQMLEDGIPAKMGPSTVLFRETRLFGGNGVETYSDDESVNNSKVSVVASHTHAA